MLWFGGVGASIFLALTKGPDVCCQPRLNRAPGLQGGNTGAPSAGRALLPNPDVCCQPRLNRVRSASAIVAWTSCRRHRPHDANGWLSDHRLLGLGSSVILAACWESECCSRCRGLE